MKFLQILVLIFGLAVSVTAQRAVLSGTITDKSGAVIPNARIFAMSETDKKFEAVTNDQGIYILNLFFDSSDTTSDKSKMAKYEITIDAENRGFKKFILKDFKFVFSPDGKMNFDIALDALNPEPCGYSGADCPLVLDCPSGQEIVQTTQAKISDKISTRPLEKLPEKNKIKGKNKNNKQ